jgi:hypothetical protein
MAPAGVDLQSVSLSTDWKIIQIRDGNFELD